MINFIDKLLKNLLNVLYPKYCCGCNNLIMNNENLLCTNCIVDLPINSFNIELAGKISQKFYGRIPVENFFSYFNYQKNGISQNIIHNLKYKGKQEIGEFLAIAIFNHLSKSDFFVDITHIVPVPIHKKRMNERGYNQMFLFSNKLADLLNLKTEESILKRVKHKNSQTKNDRNARLENVKNSFEINLEKNIIQPHFLIVDDVLTTGATLEACSKELLKFPDSKISILTLAIADNF